MVVATWLVIFVYWPISPLVRQLNNLKLAGKQAEAMQAKFKDDVRFARIKFSRFTGYGGVLEISGTVLAEDDVHYITNAVESEKSPVGIYFLLMSTNESTRFYWFDQGQDGPVLEKADLK